MIPIQDLRVGQTAQIKVDTLPYLVVEQTNEHTVFLTPDLTFETHESGYGIVKSSGLRAVLNLNSGISHLVLDNKIICGNRSTQNEVNTEVVKVNCERCKMIAKGQ